MVYKIFIIITFLFFFGSVTGWALELFYRRFFSKANPLRKWLNPGFLTGPYLPLYGFGVVVLYILSMLEIYVVRIDTGGVAHYFVMFFIMALFMTLLEFIAGEIFINGMHIRLWDYSREFGNIKGVVCPKFTFFWGILCALYYFFLFPRIRNLVLWFIAHPWFSFTVGMTFGIFIVDCAFALHLGTVLRKKAAEIDARATLDFMRFQGRPDAKFFSVYSGGLSGRIESFEEFVRRSPAKAE